VNEFLKTDKALATIPNSYALLDTLNLYAITALVTYVFLSANSTLDSLLLYTLVAILD